MNAQEDVQVLEREACFSGFYKLDRLRLRHRQFAGGMGPELSRELFVRHDAVCVLPYDPQRDCVVLIEQFRVGAMEKSANPMPYLRSKLSLTFCLMFSLMFLCPAIQMIMVVTRKAAAIIVLPSNSCSPVPVKPPAIELNAIAVKMLIATPPRAPA